MRAFCFRAVLTAASLSAILLIILNTPLNISVMRKFCKVFGPDNDQVLVVRDSEDDTEVIRYFFKPQNEMFGLCQVTHRFGTSDAAAMQADLTFDLMTATAARKAIDDARKAVS